MVSLPDTFVTSARNENLDSLAVSVVGPHFSPGEDAGVAIVALLGRTSDVASNDEFGTCLEADSEDFGSALELCLAFGEAGPSADVRASEEQEMPEEKKLLSTEDTV